MKWLSQKNLEQFSDNNNENFVKLLLTVKNTFQEVYENMEELEKCLEGCSYSETEKMLTVPAVVGTVNNKTLIL